MKFGTETELVSILLDSRHSWPETKGWHTMGFVSEFDSSFGRADVILYNLAADWHSTLGLGKICPKWAYALYSLPYQSAFSLDDFLKHTGISKKMGLNALGQFVDLHYCIRLAETQWIKVVQPREIVTEIVAIEAKLRDWNKALSQAYRYREYANFSWVVLDAAFAKPALANLNKFERLNIGLASLGKGGYFITHYKPKSLQPQSSLRFWQANAQIASQLLTAPR